MLEIIQAFYEELCQADFQDLWVNATLVEPVSI